MRPTPLKLYYVDDDATERARVHALSSMLVNPLIVCTTGAELISHLGDLSGGAVGAVIMVDAMMNAVAGETIIDQLRQDDRGLDDVPMLIVTGPKSDDAIQRAADEGADAYVVKPITLDSIMKALREVGDYRARIMDMRGQPES